MYNGFQHDLKAVCDLAHANGAYVYADIIHSAGAEPFDVQITGVDFAACSTFKWLMGDFGIGFLYAREDLLDRIRRPVMGYYQASNLEQLFPPNLPEGEYTPLAYALEKSATGTFETGTLTGGPAINVALLTASLNYMMSLGVANGSGSPSAADQETAAGSASTWIHAGDAAGVHGTDRDVFQAEPRSDGRSAPASGG